MLLLAAARNIVSVADHCAVSQVGHQGRHASGFVEPNASGRIGATNSGKVAGTLQCLQDAPSGKSRLLETIVSHDVLATSVANASPAPGNPRVISTPSDVKFRTKLHGALVPTLSPIASYPRPDPLT